MLLLVGLGNPGDQYARNRHNIGVMALDRIAVRWRFSPWKKRFQGQTAEGLIDGEKAVALKPETYMNESGRSVGDAARFLKIDLGRIIVFHDELDLAPGVLKAKTGGGHAGHNGLRSIQQHLGPEFQRVRIGIGHPGHKDLVAGYVLHDFAKADRDWIEPLLDGVADAAPDLVKGNPARFLSEVARKRGGSPAAATAQPAVAGRASDRPKPQKPATGPHPAGERMAKRQSAIAENLQKWLAKKGDGKTG
jgi:PTH1 family peptidyl-tRNA hydrolase